MQEHNIDLENSYMIGDSSLDIKLAENANMESVLVRTGQAGLDGKYNVNPTYVAENLNEAVDIIMNKKVRKKVL